MIKKKKIESGKVNSKFSILEQIMERNGIREYWLGSFVFMSKATNR